MKEVIWGSTKGCGTIVVTCDKCRETYEFDFEDSDVDFRTCQEQIKREGWLTRKIDDEWHNFCCSSCYQEFLNHRKNNQKQFHSQNVTNSGCTLFDAVEIFDENFADDSYDDNNQMTNIGVYRRIENEGLGYALLHWRIEGKNCRNPKLGKLIDNAYLALKELTEYLDDVLEREKNK